MEYTALVAGSHMAVRKAAGRRQDIRSYMKDPTAVMVHVVEQYGLLYTANYLPNE